MPDLINHITDEEIRNLDYFDKARLYHNNYLNVKYSELPQPLRIFRTEDNGLKVMKALVTNQNIKYPYTIIKLLKIIEPDSPLTHQQIYNRALFLADLCDTTVSKIIKSKLFNTRDFIPDLTDEAIKDILESKGTGSVKELKSDEYTPWVDPTPPTPPTPGPGGDYADEEKIYFFEEGNNYRCNKTFEQVIAKLPKLPAAELVYDSTQDYKNILDISSGYDSSTRTANFNFIQMYEDNIELFTIHFSAEGIEMEKNSLIISNN